MKKYLSKSVLFGLLAFSFFACSDDENEIIIPPQISTSGFYILNQGANNEDAANLAFYDFETQQLSKDVFKNQNGKKLGDTGQDLLIYGSKMYISVTGSRRIYVTDLKGKLLKTANNEEAIITLKEGDIAQEPHSLISYQGKVYASFYGGCIARIDTTSFALEKTVPVGLYPEKMVIVNNNLYVTNRSGYNVDPSTNIYKIDLAAFSTATPITVGLNPTQICADKVGNLFIACGGNWTKETTVFQMLAANTTTPKTITKESIMSMALDNSKNRILIIYSLAPNYMTSKLAYYDLTKNEFVDKSFLEGEYPSAFNITIDPRDNKIYLNTSAWGEISQLHIFTPEGKHIQSMKTEGDYPTGVYFVTKTTK